MPRIPFDRLPDSSRVWIFGSSRPMTPDEEARFLDGVDAFLDQWTAHGAPLTVGRDWREGRFLHVGLDETSVPPSGCSIDAMVNTLKGIERELDVVLVDNAPVWYRDGDTVARVSRAEFRELATSGDVGPGTRVFDNTVTRLSQVRGGEWERPAKDGWHGQAFFGRGVSGSRDRSPAGS